MKYNYLLRIYSKGSFTIYATGIENVIVSQKIGDKGSKLEKNSEFNYLLRIYSKMLL